MSPQGALIYIVLGIFVEWLQLIMKIKRIKKNINRKPFRLWYGIVYTSGSKSIKLPEYFELWY